MMDNTVKQRYDQAAHDLKPLKVNDTVYYFEKGKHGQDMERS